MRKMGKNTVLMGMLIISILGLTACGKKVADDERIKQELETNVDFSFLQDGEQIDEIMIDKRQTDKEQKTDTVWCTVVTSNEEVSCKKNIVLTYGLYDKTGWQLDDIDVEEKGAWNFTPLKGVSEDKLVSLLAGQTFVINQDSWQITDKSLIRAEIDNQQTDLEKKTDLLTVSLAIDDTLERAEGKAEILFCFDQEWKYDSVVSMDFNVSMKEEYRPDVSEDDLIEMVKEHELPVGETKQEMTVEKDEILNFKITDQTSEAKGSRQLYQCEYTVMKSGVELAMKSTIIYTYQEENGWNGSIIETKSEIISADVVGDWSGSYMATIFTEGKAELHILEVKDDGTATATFAFSSDKENGSYELEGTWDKKNLKFFLEAGDWIKEPDKIRVTNDKKNITTELQVEKNILIGNTNLGTINFTRVENYEKSEEDSESSY